MEKLYPEIVRNVYRPLLKYRDQNGRLHESRQLPAPFADLEAKLLIVPRKALSKRPGPLSTSEADYIAFEKPEIEVTTRVSATVTGARGTAKGQVLIRPIDVEINRLFNTTQQVKSAFSAQLLNSAPSEYEVFRFFDPDDAAKAAKEINAGFIGYVLLFGAVSYNVQPYYSFSDLQSDQRL